VRFQSARCPERFSDIFRPAPYVLLVVKSTHFQWVIPLVGLLHLGRKTAARDRLADLAYLVIILYELLDLYLYLILVVQ